MGRSCVVLQPAGITFHVEKHNNARKVLDICDGSETEKCSGMCIEWRTLCRYERIAGHPMRYNIVQ